MSDNTSRAAVAARAARAGGETAHEQFRESVTVERKSDPIDVVTAADREAQRAVIATIRTAFPDAVLVCEEDSTPDGTDLAVRKRLPESETAWVVDPIDGTGNYVRGIQFWTTSVATLQAGEVVGAATVLPALGDSYTAGPEGVTRNGEPITVSERTDPAEFVVSLTGRPAPPAVAGGVVREAGHALGSLRRLGSMQGALGLVAAGGLDATIAPVAHPPWDTIAGVRLVRQAGGTVTDVDGDRWRPDASGLVASNGAAHDRLVEVVAAARADASAGG